jgi:hypothetical protein
VREVVKMAVMEAVVKARTVKCTHMATTKVATTETAAAMAATTVSEGRRWHREQRCDCKSSKHRGTPGLSVTRLVGRRLDRHRFNHDFDNCPAQNRGHAA